MVPHAAAIGSPPVLDNVGRILRAVIGSRACRFPHAVRDFLETAIRRITHPESLAPGDVLSVALTVSRAGWSIRYVEHLCRQEGLLPPKEMLRWIALLTMCLVVAFSRTSFSSAASAIRITPEQARRLRKQLVPDVPRLPHLRPGRVVDAFHRALRSGPHPS